MKVQGTSFSFRPFCDSASKGACKRKLHKGIHRGMDQKVTIRPEQVLEDFPSPQL